MIFERAKDNCNRIIAWLEDIKNDGCKGVVLGLSGGKDSTVVAMLAKLVWENNVLGIIMPNGNQKDIKDAIEVANCIGINYNIVNIGTVYNELLYNINTKFCKSDNTNEKEFFPNCPKISEKAKTNIAPRLRMTTLYAIAQTLGYRVMGTGNLSERYIGWCTKFGDMGCDFNPIAHLTCSEVIELGLYLADKFDLPSGYIQKPPADGITGRTDEDNFGFTYKQLDTYLLEGSNGDPAIDEKIGKMHEAALHKLVMPATME